jgi:hypothetical protein
MQIFFESCAHFFKSPLFLSHLTVADVLNAPTATELSNILTTSLHAEYEPFNWDPTETTQPLAEIATFYPDPKGLPAAASRQGIVTISIIPPFRAGVKMTEIFENYRWRCNYTQQTIDTIRGPTIH